MVMPSDPSFEVIVISSDEESVGASRSPSPVPLPRLLTAEQAEEVARREAASRDFADFLRLAVPTALIPDNIHRYITRESSARLRLAQETGVKLRDLSIGEYCLPTWPGLNWDPEAESLHVTIQDRLVDYQVSQDLGDLVRLQIISKGNQELAKARELGVDILGVSIGPNLLPVWDTEQNADENSQALAVNDEEATDEPEPTTPQTDIWSTGVPSIMSAITPVTDTFNLSGLGESQPGCARSACDSDRVSDSCSNTSIDEYDDEFYMNNFVSPIPVWDDGEAVNIFHDAELVGGPDGSAMVDLEVYLVEGDDEELADMPEVELVVDREAFHLHFGDDEAIDVEIPNAQIFCFSHIEEAESETDSRERDDQWRIEEGKPEEAGRSLQRPEPLFQDEEKEKQSLPAATEDTIEEVMSEENEEDEDQNAGIMDDAMAKTNNGCNHDNGELEVIHY